MPTPIAIATLKPAPVASLQEVADVAFAIMYAYHHGTSLKTIKKLVCLDTDTEGLAEILLKFSAPTDGSPPKPICLELYTEESNFKVELTEEGCPIFDSWDNIFVNGEGFAHKCFKIPPLEITVHEQKLCQTRPVLFDAVKIPLSFQQKTLLLHHLIPELPSESPFLLDTPTPDAILHAYDTPTPDVFLHAYIRFSSQDKTYVQEVELCLEVPGCPADNAPDIRLSYPLASQPITPKVGGSSPILKIDSHTRLPTLVAFRQLFAGAHCLHALCTQFPQWDVWCTTDTDPYTFETYPRKHLNVPLFLLEIYRLEIDLIAAGRPAPRTPGRGGNDVFNTILTPCFQAIEGLPFSYPLYLQTIQHHCLTKMETHQLMDLSC